MVVLTAETFWALDEYWINNKISGIKLVSLYSNFNLFGQKFEKYWHIKRHEHSSSGSRVNSRVDGRTDMTKQMVAFRRFASATRNMNSTWAVCCSEITFRIHLRSWHENHLKLSNGNSYWKYMLNNVVCFLLGVWILFADVSEHSVTSS